MQLLSGSYSRAFNRRWKRSGHRITSHFDERIVESAAYMLNVIRYDVWNPVRHGFVDDPAAWKWSSYCATAGLVAPPKWLRVDLILREFSANDQEARRLFAEFVAAGRNAPNPWEGRGRVLGSDEFCDSMTRRMKEAQRAPWVAKKPEPSEVIDAVAFALDCTVQAASTTDQGRKLISYLALRRQVSLGSVARILKCSVSTVSREARRCEDIAMDDADMTQSLERARKRLG
jgi:hypothetical protein